MSPAATKTPNLTEYESAHRGCLFRVLEQPGYVLLSGATRRDYLQRQTSNDMQLAGPSRAVPNVLTAPTGRILEIFTALDVGVAYALLTPPGRGPALAAYFQKRIFFNDQVEILDQSQDWAQIELYGPKAPDALAGLGLAGAPEINEVLHFTWQSIQIAVLGIAGLGSQPGYFLIAPSAAGEGLHIALSEQHALEMSAELAEILRLEAGLPGAHELNGDFTPFEVGLAERVSGSKGCYTGQEVLARQVTYDKVTRHLAVLVCEELVEPGVSVLAHGKTVGVVSSVAQSPRLGPLAMAVLRRPYHESGTQLTIQLSERSTPAKVR